MKLLENFYNVYFNNKILHIKDYEKSRKLFIYEGCAAMGILSITSGAFLAGLAQHLGASDELNGIIGAIPFLVAVFQIYASLVFEKLERRKFLVSILCFCFRFLLGLMFLIPFLISNSNYRIIMLIVFCGTAYIIAAFTYPPVNTWMVDLTPENIRGKYFAQKDSYSLAFVTIATLVLGKILDNYRGNNSIDTGYGIVAVVVIILTITNFIFLSSIEEPMVKKMEIEIKLKDVIIIPLKNKDFRKIIILFILWSIAFQIAGPFFSVYMVTRLKLTYTYIMFMGVITSAVRVISVVYWGRFGDKRSWVSCTKYSICALALCNGLWTFVDVNSMLILVPLLHIIGGIAWAGINISLFNIQFLFSPRSGRTMYLAVNAAISGILGFISTIVGAVLLNLLQSLKFNLFMFSIGNIQILFAISSILLLLCASYVNIFIKDNNMNSEKNM